MALIALNDHWALPAYPIFEDKKSNGADQKSVMASDQKMADQKMASKKTDMTNIIATNFN